MKLLLTLAVLVSSHANDDDDNRRSRKRQRRRGRKRQKKIMSAQYRYRKCGGYGFARAWVIFFSLSLLSCAFFRCHFSRFHFSTIFRTHYALVDIICFWCSYFTLYCALMESEEEWRKRNVMHERGWIWAESTRRERERGKKTIRSSTQHTTKLLMMMSFEDARHKRTNCKWYFRFPTSYIHIRYGMLNSVPVVHERIWAMDNDLARLFAIDKFAAPPVSMKTMSAVDRYRKKIKTVICAVSLI